MCPFSAKCRNYNLCMYSSLRFFWIFQPSLSVTAHAHDFAMTFELHVVTVCSTMDQNRRHRNQLPSNIPQLQNLIKRDPSAYREEVRRTWCRPIQQIMFHVTHLQFMQQYHHYQSLRELLFVSPAQDTPHLGEIVMFLAQVYTVSV